MHTAASPAKKVLERGGQCYDLASPADKVLERGAQWYDFFKPRVRKLPVCHFLSLLGTGNVEHGSLGMVHMAAAAERNDCHNTCQNCSARGKHRHDC